MEDSRELNRLTRLVGILLMLSTCLQFIETACTFPNFLNGTWFSSDFGEITFTPNTFSTKFGVSHFANKQFTCKEQSNNDYLSVSNAFTYLGVALQIGVCWDMFSQTDVKVVYYNALPVLANTTNDRILLKVSGYAFSINNDCDFAATPDSRQLGVIIQNGGLSSAKSNCPNSLLANFNYTFDTGSGNVCSGDSGLDVCTDLTELSYNYSACSVTQGYSRDGKLTCVYSEEAAEEVFTLAINTDVTEPGESIYYKFTCYVASLTAVNSHVNMTQFPGGCHYTQTSTSVESPGAALELISSVPVAPTSSDETVISAGSIVAVVLVTAIFVALIVAGITVWCYKKWKAKYVVPGEEPVKSPPMNAFDRVSNSAFSRDGTSALKTLYPTVSELAIWRFGFSPSQDDSDALTVCTATPENSNSEQISPVPTTSGPIDNYRDVNEVKRHVEQPEPEPEPEILDYNQGLKPELNGIPVVAGKDADVSLPVYNEVGCESETPEPSRIMEVDRTQKEADEISIPLYSEVGSVTPEPTRIAEVDNTPKEPDEISIPVYSEFGSETPEPTRLSEVDEDRNEVDQLSLPVYSEVGSETPEPTRLAEVDKKQKEVDEVSLPVYSEFGSETPEPSRLAEVDTHVKEVDTDRNEEVDLVNLPLYSEAASDKDELPRIAEVDSEIVTNGVPPSEITA